MEWRRDLRVEPEKQRAAGKFIFAGLGENEEDLAELEADTRRCVGSVQSSADEAGS